MTIAATSSNPSLIPNPTVSYTNPKTTGTLTYTPVPNSTGTAVITVTVMNNGNTTFGGSNVYQQIVHRGGRPVARRSRHHDHAGQRHLHPGRGPKSLSTRALTITASNSPTIDSVTVQIIGNYDPTEDILDYVDPTGGLVTDSTGFNSATGTLTLTAVTPGSVSNTPMIFQEAAEAVLYQDTNIDTPSTLTRTIEFTVDDGAGTNSTDSAVKMITVSQVNIPPTLNPISPPSITLLENSPAVTIPLSGITAGGGQLQGLKVTVTSGTGVNDTPGLIPTPSLTYTSPNTYGNFTFQPVAFDDRHVHDHRDRDRRPRATYPHRSPCS